MKKIIIFVSIAFLSMLLGACGSSETTPLNPDIPSDPDKPIGHEHCFQFRFDRDVHWLTCKECGRTYDRHAMKNDDIDERSLEYVSLLIQYGNNHNMEKYDEDDTYAYERCTICDFSRRVTKQVEYNATYHYQYVEARTFEDGHNYVTDQYKINEEKHTLSVVETIAPTYEHEGAEIIGCSGCDYWEYGDIIPKIEHDYSGEWGYNSSQHWRYCVDEGYEDRNSTPVNHTFKEVHTYKTGDLHGGLIYNACECGYKEAIDYEYSPNEEASLKYLSIKYDGHYNYYYDEKDHWKHHWIITTNELADQDKPEVITYPNYGWTGFAWEKIESPSYDYWGECWTENDYVKYINLPDYFSFHRETVHFKKLTALEGISVSSTNEELASKDFKLYNKSEDTLICVPQAMTFTDGIAILDVENIATYAFYGNSSVNNVYLKDQVKSVGDYAFNGCDNLTDTYVSIDSYETYFSFASALRGKKHLYSKGNNFEEEELTSIDLSNLELTELPSCAFSMCVNLTSVILPTSLTLIGSSAFSNCSSLTSVNIPDSATTIGSYAFNNCSSLTSIKIPNGVTTIGAYAFSGCSSLAAIVLPSSLNKINDDICDIYTTSTELYLKVDSIANFLNFSSKPKLQMKIHLLDENDEEITDFIVPEGITNIPAYAFSCCVLNSVSLPSTLETIEENAFKYSDVKTLSVYDTTEIEDASINAKNVTVHVSTVEKLFEIKEAFGNATNLKLLDDNNEEITELTIPGTIKTLTSEMFYGLNGVKKITVENGVETIDDGAFSSLSSLEEVTIPSSVTSLGGYAFNECEALKKVNLSNGLLSLGSNCFANCTSLESISLPDTVEEVGEWIFYSCRSLKTVHLSTALTYVGYDMFENCELLEEVNIPEGITIIKDGAFSNCYSLKTVTLPNSLTKIGKKAFQNNGLSSSLVIGNNVIEIGDYAFRNCDGITSLTLGNSVETIGSQTFEYCSGLSSVVIPDSVISIGYGAFQYCGLTSLILGSGLETVGNRAFCGNDFTSLIFGRNITSIGANAVYQCDDLTELTILGPAELASGALDGASNLNDLYVTSSLVSFGGGITIKNTYVTIYDWEDFSNIEWKPGAYNMYLLDENGDSITSVDIPDTMTEIPGALLMYCKNIDEINIPVGVTSIGYRAFEETAITNVVVPEGVIEIEFGAFMDCKSLTAVTLPSTLTSFGDSTFSGCVNLETLSFNGTIGQWIDISRGSNWGQNTKLTKVICSDGVYYLPNLYE